nr:low temperature requirement protein A [Shuttleworthia satelles]
MIQTVYTNRYGKNSLFIQYLIEYFRDTTDECNRQSIKSFLWMTGIRTLGLFLCVFLPYKTGIVLYLLVVIGTFIMPIIMIRGENHFFQVNFPHLIERISLLVIIIFGEMIVGLANFFKVETFSLSSVLYFVMMVMLFLFYFAQFDHAIDERANTKGLFLIYSHYPIFISLFVVTVSMGFLVDSSANHLFVTAFFLAGIGMFQAAVLANGRYNKDYLRYTKSFCMT